MRGRDEPLERPTDGQGVLASASHNACAEDIGRHVPLCAELRCPKAIVGRTRCPIVGACVAAKARWPSLLHSRDCPHPPAPLPLPRHFGRPRSAPETARPPVPAEVGPGGSPDRAINGGASHVFGTRSEAFLVATRG